MVHYTLKYTRYIYKRKDILFGRFTLNILILGLLVLGFAGVACSGESEADAIVEPVMKSETIVPTSVPVANTPTVVAESVSTPNISQSKSNGITAAEITEIPNPTPMKVMENVEPTVTPMPEPTVQKYISRLVSKINHVFSDGNIAESDWFKGASQEALFNPNFVSASNAGSYFGANDLVIGVNHNGVQKAYPAKYMEVYEVINDRFGDEALLVTY